ncbi:ribosomal protein S18-alanine N-acetyltransferase [Vaginisenegalia massiliensis]|uniref:ribosomal protein S18-alanine N-acetyltransferase n=1 Tax=Vaginisenegalia massiliensis TaxID=2058294 RepID=UPI0013DE1AE8|nr:ribosomal protein S18-alanine N-acetyltransferase [Vaginisenegalia massiliensis]
MTQSSLELEVVPFKAYLIPDVLRQQIETMNSYFGWSQSMTQQDFQNPNAEYYVMLKGTVVLGYVALHLIIDEATINMIYLEPEFRQQGLATALMNFVIDQLTARKLKHLFLEVRESNWTARKLYQRTGFQELTIRHNYYSNPSENGVIMQRDLNQIA